MDKVLKYIFAVAVAMIIILMSLLRYTLDKKREIEKEWESAVENNKAYDSILSSSEDNDRALKLTIDQLNASKDSILQELNAARKELKIKDSKLKSMQYVSSEFTKTDTVIIKDTIFKDNTVDIDTLLRDDWYSVRMHLKYPSTVTVKPEFKSVKNIIVSAKKETVDPPKKFFLFRWFQKKHWVLNIDVIEKSPYVKSQENRYVEVLK